MYRYTSECRKNALTRGVGVGPAGLVWRPGTNTGTNTNTNTGTNTNADKNTSTNKDTKEYVKGRACRVLVWYPLGWYGGLVQIQIQTQIQVQKQMQIKLQVQIKVQRATSGVGPAGLVWRPVNASNTPCVPHLTIVAAH